MITGQIIGGEALISRIDALPDFIHARLLSTIRRLAINLQAHVKDDKLSDNLLRVRSGRLRRSINTSVEDNGSSIFGIVGTNVEYARRLEYGFNGQESVRAHIRNIKQAFGRPITPTAVNVRGFNRTANTKEYAFLRSALADHAATINAEIEAALIKGAKEGLKK